MTEGKAMTEGGDRIRDRIRERGVELVAISWVDNAGVTRAKTVPADRAVDAARNGVGASSTFAAFTALDQIAHATGYEVPTGDLRLVPDLDALATAGDGWAFAPADQRDQQGAIWPTCPRAFLRSVVTRAHTTAGLRFRMAYETEYQVGSVDGTPLHGGPGYSLDATRASAEHLLALVRRLGALDVPVEQVHPEYSPGQLEVSVGATDPIGAADRAVLVRDAIRTVAREAGLRASLSPKPDEDGLGNGAHLHLSPWRGGENLFGAGLEDPTGVTAEGRSFLAGILAELPALIAIGCASPVSYLRLGPGRWTGAYACWGIENREAPVRVIRGSVSARPRAANAELKTVDASGNPYLVAGCVIAAGLAGLAAGLVLPAETTIDPATLSVASRRSRRIVALPASLGEATTALERSAVLAEALGPRLHAAIVGVRRHEDQDAAGCSPNVLVARYQHRY